MKYILSIRTDRPEAEVGLYNPDGSQLSYQVWHAHRQLSTTLLSVIRDELAKQQASLADVASVIVFRGPGSFTGLRIGVTVANTLAHMLKVPLVGIAHEEQWLELGLRRLHEGQDDRIVLPEYGAAAHITQPKK